MEINIIINFKYGKFEFPACTEIDPSETIRGVVFACSQSKKWHMD